MDRVVHHQFVVDLAFVESAGVSIDVDQTEALLKDMIEEARLLGKFTRLAFGNDQAHTRMKQFAVMFETCFDDPTKGDAA